MKKHLFLGATLVVLAGILSVGFSPFINNVLTSALSAAVIQSATGQSPQISAPDQGQLLVAQIKVLNVSLAQAVALYKKTITMGNTTGVSMALVQKVAERKELMKQLMKSNPVLFNTLVMPTTDRTALPKVAQANVEQTTTITGKITTIHIDDFTNEKNSRYEYYIQTPSLKYSFYPTDDTPILSNTTVKVTGYALDDQITANVIKNPPVIVPDGQGPKAQVDSIGNQRTLVLLIKAFPGDNEVFTPAQAQDLVFNAQMQNFMHEQSYGKVSFSGDVFGWAVIGHTLSCYGGNYGGLPSQEELGKIVSAYNINLNNYDRIVYLSAGPTTGGCSVVGKTTMHINGSSYLLSELVIEGLSAYNSPSFWSWGTLPFAWSNLDTVLSHEMGHSLGTLHANSWYCADGQILYGDCSHNEYGNSFDAMGNDNGFSLDYNAYFKEQLGWIPPEQVLEINHSGTYTITPLELANGVKLATVDILNTTTTPYSIELRKSIGFDSDLDAQNQSGVFINRIQDGSLPATELLDMGSSFMHPTLNLPSASSSVPAFVDAGRGITIGPVLSVSTSSISFNVTLDTPSCQHFPPLMGQMYQSDSTLAAGGNGFISVFMTNEDYYGCGQASLFNGSLNLPDSWTYETYPPEDLSIGQGQSDFKTFSFMVPATTTPGQYSIDIDLLNKTGNLHKHVTTTIQITEPLTITSITPAYGPSGTVITLTGTGFDPKGNNQVSMSGVNGWTEYQTVPVSHDLITYVIPTTVKTCGNDPRCTSDKTIPTPDGDYTINLYANGSYASAPFHVGQPVVSPTATVLGTSTLRMVYDPSGNESSLVSTFTVAVNAGTSDQKIAKTYAFSNYIITDKGNRLEGTEQYGEPSGTTDDGNGFYIIPKNTTAVFAVQTVFNPKKMFGGDYYGVLYAVTLGDFSNPIQLPIRTPNTNTLTVIGMLTPYINSISPASVIKNQLVTLSGVRFTLTGNIIHLVNNVLKVDFKKTVDSFDKTGQTLQFTADIPIGDYTVTVTNPATGDSNAIDLTVKSIPPSATITGTPALALTYDQSGKESTLTAVFKVSVTAGSDDQKILKSNGAFWPYLIEQSNGNNGSGTIQYAQPTGTVSDGNFYVIPAGTTAIFTVTSTWNPRVMLAGNYHGILEQVMLGDYSNPLYIPLLPPNTTNSLPVIGELSPFITAVNPNPAKATDIVTLTGMRFSQTTDESVTLYGKTHPENTRTTLVRSADGTHVSFTPNVPPGWYAVQVSDLLNGASNYGDLYILKPGTTTIPPTIGLSVDQWNIAPGQSVTINWTVKGDPSDLALLFPANKAYAACLGTLRVPSVSPTVSPSSIVGMTTIKAPVGWRQITASTGTWTFNTSVVPIGMSSILPGPYTFSISCAHPQIGEIIPASITVYVAASTGGGGSGGGPGIGTKNSTETTDTSLAQPMAQISAGSAPSPKSLSITPPGSQNSVKIVETSDTKTENWSYTVTHCNSDVYKFCPPLDQNIESAKSSYNETTINFDTEKVKANWKNIENYTGAYSEHYGISSCTTTGTFDEVTRKGSETRTCEGSNGSTKTTPLIAIPHTQTNSEVGGGSATGLGPNTVNLVKSETYSLSETMKQSLVMNQSSTDSYKVVLYAHANKITVGGPVDPNDGTSNPQYVYNPDNAEIPCKSIMVAGQAADKNCQVTLSVNGNAVVDVTPSTKFPFFGYTVGIVSVTKLAPTPTPTSSDTPTPTASGSPSASPAAQTGGGGGGTSQVVATPSPSDSSTPLPTGSDSPSPTDNSSPSDSGSPQASASRGGSMVANVLNAIGSFLDRVLGPDK